MLPRLVNLALLGLFPLAWVAPLAHAEVMWFWGAGEVSVISGVRQLYEKDIFLCVIVVIFAMVAPYMKTVALAYVHFSETESARRLLPTIEILGRLSMTDVFLLAFYITLYRGVADIQIGWGLYLFTVLVLLAIWASWATRRQFQRMEREAREIEAQELAARAAGRALERTPPPERRRIAPWRS